ncbi:MAG: hypothetical protein WC447_01850 [Candidatus Paceibacterota bacterium]
MRKKDQWVIHNVSTSESKNFNIKSPNKSPRFFNAVKGGLTVLISVLVIYGVVHAGTITPPSGAGEPSGKFYTLSEIYNFIINNTDPGDEGDHDFTFSDALAGTGHTLTEIYNTLAGLISSDQVKKDTTYLGVTGTLTPEGEGTAVVADLFNGKTANLTGDWTLDAGTLNLACNTATFDGTGNLVSNTYDGDGDGTNRWCITDADDITVADVLSGKIVWINGATATGTMTNNGDFNLTASSTDQEVVAGYWGAGTLTGDPDLVAENIANDVNIFGIIGNLVAGWLYGDNDDPAQVLTTAGNEGDGSGGGTFNATNLSINNVRYGTAFGVDSTGTLSPYPNTPSGISGLNQSVCTTAGWAWIADSNYDGTSDDPICVQTDSGTNGRDPAGTKFWNNATANDNTFLGNYGCSGDTDGDGVGTLNTSLSGTVVERSDYGNDASVALAIADCKDGIRNLLTSAAVEAFGYTAPDATCDGTDYETCYNGPLTPKVLLEWKGTRLPTFNDFFGVCGNGTNSITYGNYGNQIGRTDNVITANVNTYEWLSELRLNSTARVAGWHACSYSNSNNVTYSTGFRVVFRP